MMRTTIITLITALTLIFFTSCEDERLMPEVNGKFVLSVQNIPQKLVRLSNERINQETDGREAIIADI